MSTTQVDPKGSMPNGHATSESPVPNNSPAVDGQFAYPQPGPQHTETPQAGPSKSHSKRKLLSTHLISHPKHPVSKAIKTEFPLPNPVIRLIRRFRVKHSVIEGLTKEEMDKWEKEGKNLRMKAGWKLPGEEGDGAVVSELFWKMYLSLMPTLERDPLSGLVPPDLLGSTTTMPLSIISLIPDIMQHYRDVIIRAEKEVFLATNYWQPSNSVNTISQSLRDLSAKVLKEGRPKVVVKVMYDRGSWEQLWNAHAPVKPEGWTPLDLPGKDEIQGLEMEVINFHRVLLGTFHAKFLIVDRKVALLNSNNIQDRPNLELMSHFEGPIVDSFYEVALQSWYNQLSPPLPCLTKPYQPPVDALGRTRYLFQDRNPYFDDIEILRAARAARSLLRQQAKEDDDEMNAANTEDHRFLDAVHRVMGRQRQMADQWAEWKPGEELNARAQNAMQEFRELRERWGLGVNSRSGSRSNSRAPSRRASADLVYRQGKYTDKATAAITAQNQNALSAVDPSEAPSTPTVVGETPHKSKTLPIPQVDGHFQSDLDSAPSSPLANKLFLSPGTNHEPKKKGHVLFLESPSNIDGTGRLFDGDGGHLTASTGQEQLTQTPTSMTAPSIANLAPPITIDGQHEVRPSPLESPVSSSQPGIWAQDAFAPMTVSKEPEVPNQSLTQPEVTRTDRIEGNIDDSAARPVPPRTASISTVDTEALPEGQGSKRLFKMSKMFNAAGVLSEAWATVEDSDELDNFRPHVVHAPHEPFPIAMCCRKPHGFPGHHDIRNPQNAAWLAGFRYAKRKVFVQTPTLNARPIVRAIKQACRRGVNVILLLDLGFNDKGESIPFQGGTNEEVVDRLYKILRKDKKEQFLKVYWYTGKDQVRPLNAVKKQRNCHIKFAAYDDEVMIIGNGNQDSQSWFHSQEVNVMIDNKQVIKEMMETLLSNQNTMQYGLVDTDGTWRDKEGKTLGDYGATEKGAFRGLSGFIAFAKTI